MTKYRTGSKEQKRLTARNAKPLAAEKILYAALKKYGLDEKIGRYHFVLRWREIMGEKLARYTRPEYLRNDQLVVSVSGSVWAQELSFHKQTILKRLQPHLEPGLRVRDIVFQVGHSLWEKAA